MDWDCQSRSGIRVSEFEPNVGSYSQGTEDECDQFQFVSPHLFLSLVDLRERSFLGLVDELVRRVVHTCIAQPLRVSFALLRGHGSTVFQSRLRCRTHQERPAALVDHEPSSIHSRMKDSLPTCLRCAPHQGLLRFRLVCQNGIRNQSGVTRWTTALLVRRVFQRCFDRIKAGSAHGSPSLLDGGEPRLRTERQAPLRYRESSIQGVLKGRGPARETFPTTLRDRQDGPGSSTVRA